MLAQLGLVPVQPIRVPVLLGKVLVQQLMVPVQWFDCFDVVAEMRSTFCLDACMRSLPCRLLSLDRLLLRTSASTVLFVAFWCLPLLFSRFAGCVFPFLGCLCAAEQVLAQVGLAPVQQIGACVAE